jgi:hypothetical protein
MSERVLFISGRCEHCKKILIGISQYEFLKPLFKVINVDTQAFPNYIKTVPSILINGQVISGNTVFEYLGKLVEGKQQQEQRVSEGQVTEKDQGQCRINSDGELEGWCGSGSGVEYSMISEENDDFTKKTYKMDTNLSFLDGISDISLQGQVQHMEKQDNQLSQKRQQFDSDFERLQRERSEVGNGMARK